MEFNTVKTQAILMQDNMFGNPQINPNDKKDLKSVTQDFESIFIQKIFESMRKTIPKTKWIDGGLGENIFTSLYDQEIAKIASKNGGFGLQNVLYKSLKKDNTEQVNINNKIK